MFKVKEIVKPSGKGRTSSWEENLRGTVTQVLETTVCVQWHDSAVEDELEFCELFSTGEFADEVPHNYCKINTKNSFVVGDE
jgi:hypothetical protein